MSSPGKLRVVLQMTALGAACLAVGYGTMKAVVPTPEETYARLAPDLRRQVDAQRAARAAQAQGAARADEMTKLDAEKPVWADGKSGRG